MQRTHIIQHRKSNSSINNWKELMFFHRGHTDGQLVYEKMLNMTNHQGNANQNHKEMPLHTCQNVCYQKAARIGKDVEKSEPLCTVGGHWCSHYGKQYRDYSKN